MITRRKLITRAAAFIAAPAIIRVATLMPIRAERDTWTISLDLSGYGDKHMLIASHQVHADWLTEVKYLDVNMHYYRVDDLHPGWRAWNEAMTEAA